ncbi:MAG: methyl-accepting chemotaxis protein [Oxalicibacterium faecigallinarum]|uniref:methyl-accepting chemotaxis protein n=1 Tax=Oxalicibacterium faecigallinarum TaxID=573741 RepID=UPI0028096BC1|nr:methyl-accepting chemotaxis protein [Oxalicibacterium faecigallinarum]MDQ7969265.1 methyl-accepting chemotaxis protein [Oxalicibacterium faecigallinarum]
MSRLTRSMSRLGIGTRLSAIVFVSIALLLGIFVCVSGKTTADLLVQRTADDMTGKARLVADMSTDQTQTRQRLLTLKPGTFYLIDLATGSADGSLRALTDQTTDGRPLVKAMQDQKEGSLRYRAQDGRDHLVAFITVSDRNWLIVSDMPIDAITQDATRVRDIAILAAIVAVLLISGVLYIVIRKTVAQPLGQATELAHQLASGDLTTRVDHHRHDEIGQLLSAINSIGQSLANVVWHIRQGTERLAVSTSEIAAGNLDLSSRTEQQAGSLEETASAMEQMTSTVKGNAGNANEANQLARTASEIAVKGGHVVGDVVHTMESINTSSKRIVDIISVIDGIAFQTNILALNAAVEAARAGEQGRGFAVVAGEVRSLAQRSSAAAREIKQLIEDSVHQVQGGSKLVAQAGATMKEVVASIQRVDAIMNEISTASREQSIGIEQVNEAIAQMDQVTQQNAALVEQAAAAADSLQNQTTELTNVVSVFKIKTSSHGTTDEAVDMVEKAIDAMQDQGVDKAFADISNKLGPFCDRDLYVVVYDMHGKNLAHGANAALIGKDLIDAKDGAGNLYVRERIAIIQNSSKGWQDYMFLNPISKQVEAKSMYLARYKDMIVGCGVYKS